MRQHIDHNGTINNLRQALQPIAKRMAEERIPVLRARAAQDRQRGDFQTAHAVERVIHNWQTIGQ